MPLTNKSGHQTYSEVHGVKRKPEVLSPRVVYEESMEFVTNKQAELYFVQHKLMHEFIGKKGLIDEFNQFQQKHTSRSKGDYANWFKKWN